MSESTQWFVLGAGLSPYTLDLWERVAARPNQRVTLAYVPQNRPSEFAHEGDFIHSANVELLPIDSVGSSLRLALRCLRSTQAMVVCMGYSPIYNLAISTSLRTTRFRGQRLFYMSDTNGVAAVERSSRSLGAQAVSLGKRLVLGTTFSTSLDLGFTNRLAHRSHGIAGGLDLPLLPVDFPADMTADVPAQIMPFFATLRRPRLLTVARLAAAKNLATLIAAFSDAIHDGMPGSLTIVGEGPERGNLERLLGRAGGRVVLAGSVPFRESRRLFGAFDAMVLPSLFEPWAIAIVEALGWGLPVLASKECGAGVSMAMEFGDAIRLCGTSHTDVRSALLGFVENLDLHLATAKRSASAVRKKFGLNEVADALVDLAQRSRSQ